jgi:hypothetical protein
MATWRVIFETHPCPTCGAPPGEHCRTATGRPRWETHVDRGRTADRCPKCRAHLAFDAEPGDLCGRCEQVRALEIERATTWKRRNPW